MVEWVHYFTQTLMNSSKHTISRNPAIWFRDVSFREDSDLNMNRPRFPNASGSEFRLRFLCLIRTYEPRFRDMRQWNECGPE